MITDDPWLPESWDQVQLFDMAPVNVGPSAQVQEVFQFWVDTLRANSATKVVLSDKRRQKIEKALKNYDVQTCKDAILGCSRSDFHMGRNGRGKKYDDIELILRDETHIERFAGDYRESQDLGF